jgi:iron complex transport system permease protein
MRSAREFALGRYRFLATPRAAAATFVIAAVALLVILCGIAFGSTWVPLETVASVLTGGGERTQRLIVLQLRAPRVAIAALSGGAIAVAGYLLQKVTGNELASPGVLGVIDGAALGVVVFLALLSDATNALTVPIAFQPVAAFAGAGLATLLVFALSGAQANSAIRLLLFGIAIAAVAKAAVIVAMVVGPIYRATQGARWLAGAVNEITWFEIQVTALGLLPTLLAVLLIARHLAPADLDTHSARGVGLDLPVFRRLVFALAALLTALAVAFVGAIGFIGLMAPHMARLVVGRGVVAGLVASFLLGATMLVGADLIVRVLFAPTEVPAGTVTAVIGAPYFLFLLMRKEKTGG